MASELHHIDPVQISSEEHKSGVAFSLQAEDYGSHVAISRALLGAVYRLHSCRPKFMRQSWLTFRRFFEFLKILSVEDNIACVDRALLTKYLIFLKQQHLGARTKYQLFMRVQSTSCEALRVRSVSLKLINNPFPGIGASGESRPHLSNENLLAVLAAAKLDVKQFWMEFEEGKHPPQGTPLSRSVAYIREKFDGVIPSNQTQHDLTLKKLVASAGGQDAVERRLYATPDTMLPFLLLIGFNTAANADSLQEFERGCCTPDEFLEGQFNIRWWKGRTRFQQAVMRSGRGMYSAPSLIGMVQQMTAPLMSHAHERWRNRLFVVLSRGNARRFGPITSTMCFDGLRRFVTRHNLRGCDGKLLSLNLGMLRPSVLAEIYRLTKSPIAVKRFANHRNIETTWRYVVDRATDELHDLEIARSQHEMFQKVSHRSKTLEQAKNPEHVGRVKGFANDCRDPMDAARAVAPGEICPAWFAPLNNPGLLIPDDPIYAALIIRRRHALTAARQQMSVGRFEKIYLPILLILENELLPSFSEQTLTAAVTIAESQPALPVFADE